MEGSLVAYKVFTNGSVLQASEINDNLMRQSVMVFSNAAARTAAITSPTEGMITYLEDVDRFESRTASAWVQLITPGGWVSFTPSFSGFTLGNGTVVARYTQIGQTVHFFCRVTLGSTSSVSGTIGMTLPIAKSATMEHPTGQCSIEQTGTRFPSIAMMSSSLGSNQVGMLIYVTNTSFLETNLSSATYPWTWTTNHKFAFQGTYEAA